LRLVDGGGECCFGRPSAGFPSGTIEVHDPRFYTQVVRRGSLGAGEAFRLGWWTSPDLVATLRMLALNAAATPEPKGTRRWLGRALSRWSAWRRRNTLRGAQANIAVHYDLREDFFRLFLDDSLTYSSAIFSYSGASLGAASLAKCERACEKLQLLPEDRVLEIGTGWGGLAQYMASEHGCQVTSTTISRRQFEFARRRIVEAGLVHRVEILCQDYRNLQGRYDKLVSIEMIEAVGHEFLPEYFAACGRLLAPDGKMVLQAITLPDERYERYRRSQDFIQAYVFPGGCLPSLGALCGAVRSGNLRIIHLEDFSAHYAQTLSQWRRRFWENIDQVRRLGFDECFIRTWDYYLAYCQAGFAERQVGVVQLVLAGPKCRDEPLYGLESIATLS